MSVQTAQQCAAADFAPPHSKKLASATVEQENTESHICEGETKVTKKSFWVLEYIDATERHY
jgi:hypothetical protein